MNKEYLRTFKPYDIEDVQQHLLIMGDLSADCASCRQLGLGGTVASCPNCGTQFKYLTSRRFENHPGERFQIASRLREIRPELVFIDYEDYKRTLGRKKARDFFHDA